MLIPTATAATGNQLPPAVDSLETHWENIRGQFIFEEQRVPMNAANLCPSPRAVAERVSALTQDIDRDCSSQNRRKFRDLLEQTRKKIAKSLGTSANQLALVRNTSEANNIVNSGLPLKAGDEVVLWDQNHPTNNVAWEVRAARFGFRVTRASTPSRPTGIDELVGTFERALTPDTRVLALTHVSNVTGIRLPIPHLCEVAHRLGIHVHVDGAQSWGALAVDLEMLGCDSFTASAHKWFLGPKEVGLLYIRTEAVDRLWPSVVAPSWGNQVEPRPVGARKFESMGQRDDAALAATGTADDFHSRIGRIQIEDRITTLTTRLKEGLVESGYKLVTPMDPDLSGGVCIAEVPSNERPELIDKLYTEHGIAGAATGGLRLCPHLYNTTEHIDRAIRGAKELKA
jgi:selenocysteine lyase/cysteine desulfurase